MSGSNITKSQPHLALLPSSGMGHLTPFLRLATSLANHNCRITLITTYPTVSLSESQLISRFLSSFPQVTCKQFHLLPLDQSTANSKDPFFLRFEAIRRSAHLLSPILSSSSPPLSALITDITLTSAFLPITASLGIPNYLLFTSSAKMLSVVAYFPSINSKISSLENIQIPGSPPIPLSWLPPLFLDSTSLFTTQFVENGKTMVEANGVLINTFDSLEKESLSLLNQGKVVVGFPPVISIGPLVPCNFEHGCCSPLSWLDDQPDGSVVYVSFGSRTAMLREQIRELGDGLVKSGCTFLWVVKDKKVDKEDEEGLEHVLGDQLMEKVNEKGLVVKEWVDQDMILSHRAVGGFMSHCGWNSVTEAAWHGVPILAWPQGGDQKINAEVVERNGLGKWATSWGWGGGALVVANEIGKKVREMMADEGLRVGAIQVREEARRAVGSGGSSEEGLIEVIESLGRVRM